MRIGPVMIDLEGLEITSQEEKLLEHPFVGGVIFFARNYQSPQQIAELVDSIRAIRPEILIAVDQEGGRVQRFKKGFTALPTMRRFGELYDEDPERARMLTETCGWLMATEVLSVGVDFSFAPILDLDRNISEIIGNRAFHSDPEVVIDLANLFIHGMFKAGMSATGKHFPGHGCVAPDSHLEIPYDNSTLEVIRAADMLPFKVLINHGLKAIMPAHIIYQQVDDMPACFSSRWLKDVLRGELGFQGAIFSDDLSMEGASVVGDFSQRAKSALEAGCDMVLVCNHPDAINEVLAYLPTIMSVDDNPRLAAMRGVGKYDYETLLENPNYQQAKKMMDF